MIFFLNYDIRIHDESSDYYDIDSKARCWVKAPNLEAADIMVRNDLKEYKWKILNLQDGRAVKENYYPENSIERAHFYEATAKDKLIMIDIKPKRKPSS